MFRALLIDLDDTLYDRGSAFRAWIDELAAAQLGRALTDDERAIVNALDERGHRSRYEFAVDIHERIGLHIDAKHVATQLAEHAAPEPGVREVIATLAAELRIAIVTNGGPAQHTKLARIGLADIVHAKFLSSELGIAKPDPAIFAHALRWTEQAPADVLFVGDHPWVDIAPAAAAGMATAWRARDAWPAELAPPTYRIEAIAQLLEIARGTGPANQT